MSTGGIVFLSLLASPFVLWISTHALLNIFIAGGTVIDWILSQILRIMSPKRYAAFTAPPSGQHR